MTTKDFLQPGDLDLLRRINDSEEGSIRSAELERNGPEVRGALWRLHFGKFIYLRIRKCKNPIFLGVRDQFAIITGLGKFEIERADQQSKQREITSDVSKETKFEDDGSSSVHGVSIRQG